MAGKITIAEVEQVVEIGELDPDEIHLPEYICEPHCIKCIT